MTMQLKYDTATRSWHDEHGNRILSDLEYQQRLGPTSDPGRGPDAPQMRMADPSPTADTSGPERPEYGCAGAARKETKEDAIRRIMKRAADARMSLSQAVQVLGIHPDDTYRLDEKGLDRLVCEAIVRGESYSKAFTAGATIWARRPRSLHQQMEERREADADDRANREDSAQVNADQANQVKSESDYDLTEELSRRIRDLESGRDAMRLSLNIERYAADTSRDALIRIRAALGLPDTTALYSHDLTAAICKLKEQLQIAIGTEESLRNDLVAARRYHDELLARRQSEAQQRLLVYLNDVAAQVDLNHDRDLDGDDHPPAAQNLGALSARVGAMLGARAERISDLGERVNRLEVVLAGQDDDDDDRGSDQYDGPDALQKRGPENLVNLRSAWWDRLDAIERDIKTLFARTEIRPTEPPPIQNAPGTLAASGDLSLRSDVANRNRDESQT